MITKEFQCFGNKQGLFEFVFGLFPGKKEIVLMQVGLQLLNSFGDLVE